jgi:hypothetical protein
MYGDNMESSTRLQPGLTLGRVTIESLRGKCGAILALVSQVQERLPYFGPVEAECIVT